MPNVGGIPQGSPLNGQQSSDLTADLYAQRGLAPNMAAPPGQSGNHALQDYQMQLMLLEQQNKKRLLMARQEQDNSSMNHPGQGPGPGGPGQAMPQGFAQGMSPQARPGPSPNPGDQMKRGTPKMGQSPLPDAAMQQQGSPAPNFDPSQMPPNIHPQFYNQIKAQQEGMQMAPNGQMMRPPNANPAFAGGPMNPEMMLRQQRQATMQNGINFPPGNPQSMMQQPQQGQQPSNMGTPQQQQRSMPPPPAPTTGGDAIRTQPSSPAQNQPPTPSQTNKSNPKKKAVAKDNKVCHIHVFYECTEKNGLF